MSSKCKRRKSRRHALPRARTRCALGRAPAPVEPCNARQRVVLDQVEVAADAPDLVEGRELDSIHGEVQEECIPDALQIAEVVELLELRAARG